MDDRPHVPAFTVHRVTLDGLTPLARYYYCTYCEQDLTDWVMKQPANEASACPKCDVCIAAREIAQAQRDTRLGCFWTPVSIICFFLVVAAIVGILWLITGINR